MVVKFQDSKLLFRFRAVKKQTFRFLECYGSTYLLSLSSELGAGKDPNFRALMIDESESVSPSFGRGGVLEAQSRVLLKKHLVDG